MLELSDQDLLYHRNRVGYRSGLILFACGLVFALANSARAEQPLRPYHDLTYYLDQEGKRQQITDFDTWEFRRRSILQAVQEVMGPLPVESRRVPLDVRVEEEVKLDGGVLRQKITYQSEPGSRVPAYLFIPAAKKNQPLPAVLCLHQTSSLGKGESAGITTNDKSYALDLAQRGYVTIAPDYPSFGEHAWNFDADHGYVSGSMKSIWDNMRAIDLLQSLPEVDKERIGAIGHSLGGHGVIFTGLFDPRIKVIVSSCGFTRLDKDDLPSWTGPRYMPRIASEYNNEIEKLPFDFPELIAALAPRPFLTCSATKDADFDVQGVKDSLQFASPIYKLYEAQDLLQGFYPEGPHGFPESSRQQAFKFFDKQLRDASILRNWPKELPETNGPVWIPAQSWPQHPGERRVRVSVYYPNGQLSSVNEQTGIMLTLHNWGGTDCAGTASPGALARELNVIALCVNYLQSGAQASIHDPEPYDFGYLQALDALRAIYFVKHTLEEQGTKFAAGRMYATGGSGGGNVTLMAGKLAPRTFAVIIDMCGMARLTDDIAFNLPGGSGLDARFSQDPKSKNWLSPGRQELHYVGNPQHLAVMKKLDSSHRTYIVHGSLDTTCPFEDAKEMAANMEAAGLDVRPHFLVQEDLDGKVYLSLGHSLGNRTEIVFKEAGNVLEPGGEEAMVLKTPSDFDRRDERVRYPVTGGTYIISYQAGYPVGRFEPGE